jgi:hypothetical protein
MKPAPYQRYLQLPGRKRAAQGAERYEPPKVSWHDFAILRDILRHFLNRQATIVLSLWEEEGVRVYSNA